ncbi:MAG: hypothetical protein ACOY82_02180 [Pseudomonadota bacterium]
MSMHWRDIDRRLEPGVWDGLLISIASDRKPGFVVSVCPPDRLRVSVRDEPLCWARIDDDHYGYEILRRGRNASWAIVPPIPFRLADDIAKSSLDAGMRRWSRQFATWLWESTRAPLMAGEWMLGPHMRWHKDAMLAPGDIEGILAHEAREYIDWDHEVHPLPLRDMSSPDDGRVKAWRKLARRGELPPILLYWVSGLVAYVVLDGHDRLLAARLERTPAAFLCLDRVAEFHRDMEHQQTVLAAVGMAIEHSDRTKGGANRDARTFTAEKANRILLEAFVPRLAEQPTVADAKLVSRSLWESEVVAEAERLGVDVAEMIAEASGRDR